MFSILNDLSSGPCKLGIKANILSFGLNVSSSMIGRLYPFINPTLDRTSFQGRRASTWGCSQVFVMRRSLDILDIFVLLESDATISKLSIADSVLAIVHGASASPVPVETTHVLESGHLFICQVGDDLEHVATVAINAEHVVLDEVGAPDAQLEKGRAAEESTDDPLGLHRVAID